MMQIFQMEFLIMILLFSTITKLIILCNVEKEGKNCALLSQLVCFLKLGISHIYQLQIDKKEISFCLIHDFSVTKDLMQIIYQ